jgi:predicted RNA-binding Zn-ribbon protein involved in translation (DUF1610 family)
MSNATKQADEKFCHECGATIKAKAEICPKCGVRQPVIAGMGDAPPPAGAFKCVQCGYQGPMKTWLRNYNFPQLIAIIGVIFYVIPGIGFIAWAWGKHKCPNCGKVGEHIRG